MENHPFIIPGALVKHRATSAIGIIIRTEEKSGRVYADVKYDEDYIVCAEVSEFDRLTRTEFVKYRVDKWLNEILWNWSLAGKLLIAASILISVYFVRMLDVVNVFERYRNTVI